MTTAASQLEQKVAALCRAETYPDAPRRIEVVETHMSFVFLTPTHAYKMKKPVRYELLDFSTLELRRRNCEEELRLNQRLAPGIYLAVLPLVRSDGTRLSLGADGAIVEWLVQMRRLPQRRMLDEQIRAGRLAARDIDALAERLARFYGDAEPQAVAYTEHLAHLEHEIDRDREAFEQHAETLDPRAVAQIGRSHLAFLRDRQTLLKRRVEERRLVEGHGDLRPEHVCLLDPPVVFDCIEFNRRLRIVDPVAELAFLALECELLGAPQVGARLLACYSVHTGDNAPPELIDYYKSRSAAVRARLSLLHTRDLPSSSWGRWIAAGRRYFEFSLRYAQSTR
jgi:aminoglycoside phosphotransferase family enzyme